MIDTSERIPKYPLELKLSKISLLLRSNGCEGMNPIGVGKEYVPPSAEIVLSLPTATGIVPSPGVVRVALLLFFYQDSPPGP